MTKSIRIAKASAAFGQLRGSVWDRSGNRLGTKLKVYRAAVLPTLRNLLGIKWQDMIPDTDVLKRAEMQSVHILLKLAQLRWAGHGTRMPEESLPKKILYGELEMDIRSHGGQKKRYYLSIDTSIIRLCDQQNSDQPADPHSQISPCWLLVPSTASRLFKEG